MSIESGAGRIRDILAPVTRFVQRQSIAPPTPLTQFVGREREVTTACMLLRRMDVRLLTLTGAGGIGKTRLALAIASELAGDIVDGIVWVPLTSIHDPPLVVPAIAKALGIGETNGHSLVDIVRSALFDKELLLLIDNFEQVLTAAPNVAELLISCPALKVLVTSRSPLRISGERILPVPPLTLPDPRNPPAPERLVESEAVRLFVERANTASPPFVLNDVTGPLVAQICWRLDGLPLAIELAAARVYHLSLETLHARLERRLQMLTGGPRDVPERHRTMHDAIAWSYDLLSPEEQALFRGLTVFAGGFTLEAAEAVCTHEPNEGSSLPVIDGLTSLVDKSLVRYVSDLPGDPRYMFLETIREYGRAQLASHDHDTAYRQRHAAFFLALPSAARREMTTGAVTAWVDRIEADHDNSRLTLTWLAQTDQWCDCLRLACALSPFWDIRGHVTEGRTWLERTLDPARTSGAPPSLCATASMKLGTSVLRQGDYDLAEAHLEAARTAWLSLQDAENLPYTLMMLGGVAEYRGDDVLAQSQYEQALALFREREDLTGVSEVLNNLADTCYRRGDLTQAEALAQEAIALARESTLPVPIADALITLGEIASARSEGQHAVAVLREGLYTSRDAAYQLGLADAMTGLADVAASTGDPLRAARLLGAVDALAARLGVSRLPHQALQLRATTATQAGLDEQAFATALAEGRALSLNEALAEAGEVSAGPVPPVSSLFTPREREILQLLVKGKTDRAIADALYISTRTVESHVARIFAKLDVHTRAGAVSTALTTGLIDPPFFPSTVTSAER
ncbi:MAG: ATP-binding protein [Thermomicrobiales bacterium]